jgi:hypothetical protein
MFYGKKELGTSPIGGKFDLHFTDWEEKSGEMSIVHGATEFSN